MVVYTGNRPWSRNTAATTLNGREILYLSQDGADVITTYSGDLTPQMFAAGADIANGTINATTAIQAALTAATALGRDVCLPAGTYLCTANLSVPVGTPTVSIYGEGDGSIIQFSGAAVDKGVYFNGVTGYKQCGAIRNLQVLCSNGALEGVTFFHVFQAWAERVTVRNALGAGILFDETLESAAVHCLITGCGSATKGQIDVDHSTTFLWLHNYISGGAAAASCGLKLETSGNITIIAGAIESTQTPIKASSTAGRTNGVSQVTIRGLDMENPGTHPYIEVGNGWDGPAGGAGVNWSVEGCVGSGSVTPALQIDHAIWLEDTQQMEFRSNVIVPTGSPIATFWLEGAGNSGLTIGPHRTASGSAWPWVMVNGTMRPDASPRADFNLEETTRGIPSGGQPTANGVNPSALVTAAQGGYYGTLWCNNGSATDLTTLTGGRRDAEVILVSTNGNTTLKHGTSTDQFRMRGGIDVVMTANLPYRFWHNGTGWVQF